MVGSLGPAVGGVTREVRWVQSLHVVGLMVGALFSGAVLVLLGGGVRLAGGWRVAIVVAIACLLCTGFELVGGPVLQSPWQVPESWRHAVDVYVLGAVYGAILGVGVATRVGPAPFWGFASLSLAMPPALVIAGWAAYGGGRSAGFLAACHRRDAGGFGVPSWLRSGIMVAGIAAGIATATGLL
jgi:hypothetical protein